MKTVRDIPELTNKRVLLRTALNTPIADGKVVNTFRLQAALPTIAYLKERQARVILISHVSGETGLKEKADTLEPMWRAMQAFIPDIRFCPEAVGSRAQQAVAELPPGGVLMLENLRRHPGEESNDPEFAKAVAALGDLFVQDQFDVSHRNHAGIVGIPNYLPSYAGFLLEKEVMELSKALSPDAPSVAIISGAKFSSKEPVIKKLMAIYDHVMVGGALANDFLRAKGYFLGASLVSDRDAQEFTRLMEHASLLIPVDAIVAPLGARREQGRVSDLTDIQANEAILDVGPRTSEMLAEHIRNARSVLWSGPLGNYENGFMDGTAALAQTIAESSAHSVVGGGDTIVAIETLGLSDRFSFLSTGGGAMLDFLSEGTLPGIEALS